MLKFFGVAILLVVVALTGKCHYEINQKKKEFLLLARQVQNSCIEDTTCPVSLSEFSGHERFTYSVVDEKRFELYFYVGPDWWFNAAGGPDKKLEAWVQIDNKKTAVPLDE